MSVEAKMHPGSEPNDLKSIKSSRILRFILSLVTSFCSDEWPGVASACSNSEPIVAGVREWLPVYLPGRTTVSRDGTAGGRAVSSDPGERRVLPEMFIGGNRLRSVEERAGVATQRPRIRPDRAADGPQANGVRGSWARVR